MSEKISKQSTIEQPTPEIILPQQHKRGGARPGAGRKPGSTNLISANEMLEALRDELGEDFHRILAQDFASYRMKAMSGDGNSEYLALLRLLGERLLPKQQIDITSNGKMISPTIVFDAQELSEWNEDNNNDDQQPPSH